MFNDEGGDVINIILAVAVLTAVVLLAVLGLAIRTARTLAAPKPATLPQAAVPDSGR